MKDTDKTKELDLYSYFQAKRLVQIFWAIEVTLALVFIQRLYLAKYTQSYLVISVALVLVGVYILAKKNKILASATLLLSVMTVFVTYFLWRNAGIYDEVLLAYPCILIMAAMLGDKKLFFGLVIFMSISVTLNGLSNHLQWYLNKVHVVSINSAILVLLIILLISYTVWIMAKDFRKLLQRITEENKEVIKSKKEIEALLHHDILTGLPNRMMAQEIFKKATYKAKRDDFKVCLMFIDLDNFKLINDGLGHQAGDALLTELSQRLKSSVRETDSVCRFAGDEFIIILESVKNNEFLAKIAQGIITTIQKPYYYQNNEFTCSCSIGISVSPHDGTDFDSLVRNADTAMYHSKSIGGNSFHFFDADMNSDGHDYLNIVTDLRKALIEEQFVLHYQPKIDLVTNRIIGAEALIRWQHPEKGLIFPDHFIPQAEKSGLIVEIGDWVLQQACKACNARITTGFTDFSIAVNVSSQQFKRGNFSAIVETALQKSGLTPKQLELEMTESLLIENSDELKQTVKYLQNLCVSFSIDDFGTGYSNLGYIKEFEIESLKIDRSFVHDIKYNPKNKAIVTAIIQMAKSLDLYTIAEGIENKEIADALISMQCNYAQGFYWSKALDEVEFMVFAIKYPNMLLNQ